MLIMVVLVIFLVSILILVKTIDDYDFKYDGLFILIATISGVATAIMTLLAIMFNAGSDGQLEAAKQERALLVYQLENKLYDNDNDLGKKELYDQIMRWNADVASGKRLQHDILCGPFIPDIYDELEIIDVEKIA